jgi:hypothetical protein
VEYAENLSPSLEQVAMTEQIDVEFAHDDFDTAKHWLLRHKTALLVGAAAISTAITLASDPLETTKERVFEAAPWVASGLAAGEVFWIGGAAMMLAAVGNKVRNPLKIKQRVPELAEHANNSLLFRAGFWTNTFAAVGQTAVLVAGVTSELPVKSWGLLSFAAADFALTISVRRAIKRGVRASTLPVS